MNSSSSCVVGGMGQLSGKWEMSRWGAGQGREGPGTGGGGVKLNLKTNRRVARGGRREEKEEEESIEIFKRLDWTSG